MLDENHHELLAQVASLYYEKDLTQNEIADAFNISRVKVYRLLKQAKETGVVRIVVDYPIKRDTFLEDMLRETFGLADARVLQTTAHHHTRALGRLGQLSARYLENILKDVSTMAICLGRTTYEVIHAIRPDFQAKVRVVQAIGSSPYSLEEYDSSSLARQLAQKLGGEALYLLSPVMADTIEAAHTIRNQRDIKRTLNVAKTADIALIGIGNLDLATSGFVRAGIIDPQELLAFSQEGAVGDIAWQIYSEDGQLHPCDFNKRVIGITLEELAHIPMTIAAAMGAEKGRAILGALRTGTINVLCTDDQAAHKVLELHAAQVTAS